MSSIKSLRSTGLWFVILLMPAPAGSQLLTASDGAGQIAHYDDNQVEWVVTRGATSLQPGEFRTITVTTIGGFQGTTVELWGTDWANFLYGTDVAKLGGPCGGGAITCVQFLIWCDEGSHLWGQAGTDSEQSDELWLRGKPGVNDSWRSLGRWDCDKSSMASYDTLAGLSLVTSWGDELHIPPGALHTSGAVGLANSFPLSDPWAVPSGLFPITEGIVVLPTGLTLLEPATVIIRYSNGEVRGAAEGTVGAYQFDTLSREWQSFAGSTIDTGNNTITLTVTTFGEFGFTGASTEGSVGGCCWLDNPCENLTEGDCLTLRGAPLGPGMDCDSVDCPHCDCPYQADNNASGFVDATDLAIEIDAVFFSGVESRDPICPATRCDLNGDGFTDAVDLAEIIDHVFFGGPGPYDPCLL